MHIPAVCGPAPLRARDMILRHNGAVRAAVSAAVSAFTMTSGCNSFCAPRGLRSNSSPAKGVHAAMPHVAALRSRGLRAAGLARQIRKTRCVQICAYRTASAIRSRRRQWKIASHCDPGNNRERQRIYTQCRSLLFPAIFDCAIFRSSC